MWFAQFDSEILKPRAMSSATRDQIAEGKPSFIGDYYETLRKTSVLEKSATGGVVGWCVGYLLMRTMKLVSALAGVSCLIALVVHYFKLIAVDWDRMQARAASSVSSVAAKVKEKAGPNLADNLREQVTTNTPFSGGLVVGIMLGIAAS